MEFWLVCLGILAYSVSITHGLAGNSFSAFGQAFPNFYDLLIALPEKHPVSFTEIVFIKSGIRLKIPIALAASPAESEILTEAALFIQFPGLLDELNLAPSLVNVVQAVSVKIPQTVLIHHIKIAWIHTSVCFYHILDSTDSSLFTGFRHVSCRKTDIIFKLPDKRLLSAPQILVPQPE